MPGKVLLLWDGAPIHRSRVVSAYLQTQTHWLHVERLPAYAPELNPVEHVWDELREKHFHNRVFDSLDALEDQLELALRAFETNAPMVQPIVAWEWIVRALLN